MGTVHGGSVPLTRFVGRGDDVAGVRAALGAEPLVTLLGPGGVGKTRLALEVASAWDGEAWFVDLAAGAAVLDPELEDALAAGDRHLVVLDNCEHVRVEAGELAARLLACGPGVAVLATSRAPLGVAGEAAVAVEPLGPDAAAELFVDRARLVRPTAVEPAEVVELCRRLDGLPLAIELAAARTRVLSVAEIDEHLSDRLRLLRSADPTTPDRHATIEATIAWSEALLDAADAAVLRRLSVFAGGFDLGAAAVVAGAAGVDALDVLDRLVARSLVAASFEPTRYSMLETVRAYLAARLEATGEVDVARRHLVDWAVAAAAAWDERREEPGAGAEAATSMRAEAANVELALDAAVELDGPAAVAIAASVAPLWSMGRRFDHGRRRVEAALAAGDGAPPLVRARAMNAAATLAIDAGEPAAAEPLLLASLALRSEHGDGRGAANAANDLGVLALRGGDPDGAVSWLTRAAELAAAAGDPVGACTARLNSAAVTLQAGRAEEALDRFDAAAAEAEAVGSALLAAGAHANAAAARLALGRATEALPGLAAAARLTLEHRDLSIVPEILAIAAGVAEGVGRPEDAVRLAGAAAAGGAASDELDSLVARARSTIGSAVAGRLGDEGAATDLADLVAELAGAGPRATASPGEEDAERDERGRLRFDGDRWELAWAGTVSRLADSRGLRYLARLLADPGGEVHCLELTALAQGGAVAADGDAGPVLDQRALAAYRARHRELEAERDEAQGWHDEGRVARIDAELAALAAQLAGAVGLGGRSRRAGGDAERARKAVTNRVRDAVRRIADADPALGRHLEVAVRTGTFCTYRPDRPVRWVVEGA